MLLVVPHGPLKTRQNNGDHFELLKVRRSTRLLLLSAFDVFECLCGRGDRDRREGRFSIYDKDDKARWESIGFDRFCITGYYDYYYYNY